MQPFCWEVILLEFSELLGYPRWLANIFGVGEHSLFFLNRNRAPRKKTLKIFRPGAYCLRSFFFQMISLISDQFTLVACFIKGRKY